MQNLIKFPSLNLSLKMPLDCKSITSICCFNTDVVVLTQTMGLLNHLKPLLCYVKSEGMFSMTESNGCLKVLFSKNMHPDKIKFSETDFVGNLNDVWSKKVGKWGYSFWLCFSQP